MMLDECDIIRYRYKHTPTGSASTLVGVVQEHENVRLRTDFMSENVRTKATVLVYGN